MITIKENDILVSSGGWECTRVAFYKVIKVGKRFITLRQLACETVKHEPFAGTAGSGEVTARDCFASDKTFRRQVEVSGTVWINKYEAAYAWDGKPQFYDYRNI
jgi:hypothetical protein